VSANPNPARVTDAMWEFWLAFRRLEPGVELGGIYADKPGYHNIRAALPASDYSVQAAADRQGPADKAAAIDLTFPSAQRGDYSTIRRYAARLLGSGRDPDDERGDCLREFFGQANADSAVEGWDFQAVTPSTSDSSHLWHIHISFVRAHLDDPRAFGAVLSILRGETAAYWRVGIGDTMATADPQRVLLADPPEAPQASMLGNIYGWTEEGLLLLRQMATQVEALAAAPHNVAALSDAQVERLAGLIAAQLAAAVPGHTHTVPAMTTSPPLRP
jgi:hypothetical protein